MDNIIPPSVNDKFNVLFKHINNIYETFINLTSNYFIIDEQNNKITVTGDVFTIHTDDKKINFGSNEPIVSLIYTDNSDDISNETNATDGSIYLSNDNFGEGYLKVDEKWTQLCTTDIYILSSNTTISSTESGTSIFGSSNKISLYPNQVYELEYNIYFLKNVSDGILTFVVKYDYQPDHHIIHSHMNNNSMSESESVNISSENSTYSCIIYNTQNTNIEISTKSIEIDNSNYIKIKILITNIDLINNVDLLLFNSDGTTTVLKKSNWNLKKIIL